MKINYRPSDSPGKSSDGPQLFLFRDNRFDELDGHMQPSTWFGELTEKAESTQSKRFPVSFPGIFWHMEWFPVFSWNCERKTFSSPERFQGSFQQIVLHFLFIRLLVKNLICLRNDNSNVVEWKLKLKCRNKVLWSADTPRDIFPVWTMRCIWKTTWMVMTHELGVGWKTFLSISHLPKAVFYIHHYFYYNGTSSIWFHVWFTFEFRNFYLF